MSSESTQLNPGQMLQERYRIEEAIGRGGFAEVYRATRLDDGRAVAVKLLSPVFEPRDADVRRFEREMALVRQLDNPHVVRLLDSGHGPTGLPYAVFELVSGRSLAEEIDQRGALPVAHVAAIAGHVLEGLAAAHQLGMVHRDLKPDNILLEPAGGRGVMARIIDFGLAKALWGDESQRTKLTAAGMVVGTPQYMAPEQARGEPVAAASDLYSLGLIMAEALTGQPVVAADIPSQAMLAQLASEPLPLAETVLRSALAQVIRHALHKSTPQRTATAEQMSAELRAAQSAVVVGLAPTTPVQIGYAPTAPIQLGASPTAPAGIGRAPAAPIDLGFAPTAPPDTAHAHTALPQIAHAPTALPDVAHAPTALPDVAHAPTALPGASHGGVAGLGAPIPGQSAVEEVFGRAAPAPSAGPSAPPVGPGPSGPPGPAASVELELLPLDEPPAAPTPPPMRRAWPIVLAVIAVLLLGGGTTAVLYSQSGGWEAAQDEEGDPWEGFDDEEQYEDYDDVDEEQLVGETLIMMGAKKMPGLAALDPTGLRALLQKEGWKDDLRMRTDPPSAGLSQTKVEVSKHGSGRVTVYLRRYDGFETLAHAVTVHAGRRDAVAFDGRTMLVILQGSGTPDAAQLLGDLIDGMD